VNKGTGARQKCCCWQVRLCAVTDKHAGWTEYMAYNWEACLCYVWQDLVASPQDTVAVNDQSVQRVQELPMVCHIAPAITNV
jgi:hypothetical protein